MHLSALWCFNQKLCFKNDDCGLGKIRWARIHCTIFYYIARLHSTVFWLKCQNVKFWLNCQLLTAYHKINWLCNTVHINTARRAQSSCGRIRARKTAKASCRRCRVKKTAQVKDNASSRYQGWIYASLARLKDLKSDSQSMSWANHVVSVDFVFFPIFLLSEVSLTQSMLTTHLC